MVHLFRVVPHEITLFVKPRERTMFGDILKTWIVYRSSDVHSMREVVKLLDDFESCLFVSREDEVKLNPFNPFRRLIQLSHCDIHSAVSHVLSAIELYLNEHKLYILAIVTHVAGEWSLWVSPEGARAVDALLALKAIDTYRVTHPSASVTGTNVESKEDKVRGRLHDKILPTTGPKGGISL